MQSTDHNLDQRLKNSLFGKQYSHIVDVLADSMFAGGSEFPAVELAVHWVSGTELVVGLLAFDKELDWTVVVIELASGTIQFQEGHWV